MPNQMSENDTETITMRGKRMASKHKQLFPLPCTSLKRRSILLEWPCLCCRHKVVVLCKSCHLINCRGLTLPAVLRFVVP